MSEDEVPYITTTNVILVGGPLDGAVTQIPWVKTPGKTPPAQVCISSLGHCTAVGVLQRTAVYDIIDNWPLRYQFRGYQEQPA